MRGNLVGNRPLRKDGAGFGLAGRVDAAKTRPQWQYPMRRLPRQQSPNTRAGILAKRSDGSKRKLSEISWGTPHIIHRISTTYFSIAFNKKAVFCCSRGKRTISNKSTRFSTGIVSTGDCDQCCELPLPLGTRCCSDEGKRERCRAADPRGGCGWTPNQESRMARCSTPSVVATR